MKWVALAITLALAAATVSGLAITGPLLSEWATDYGV